MIRVPAPAKLNLRLEVLAREESGYHQLETLFCALDLADELTVELTRAAGIELTVTGAELGPLGDNLVHRAAAAYFAASAVTGGARITLHKRIPAGAGLGGGSSDAAATLSALDALHHDALGAKGRLALGARLGSDVPFFLCGSPLALAWGRGGRLLPLEPLPAADVLLLVPAHGVSTAEAYAALAAARPPAQSTPEPRVVRWQRLADWHDVARNARNDFELVVLPRIPELAGARDVLHRHGALFSLLTGSGAVFYGVFTDAGRLHAADRELATSHAGLRTIATRTAALPAPPPFG